MPKKTKDRRVKMESFDEETKATTYALEDTHVTAAYRQFQHRLEEQYKLCENPEKTPYNQIEKLFKMTSGNTTEFGLDGRKWLYRLSALMTPLLVGIPYVIYYKKAVKLQVAANHFALVTDRSGTIPCTKIYGPGYHFLSMYHKLQGIYRLSNDHPVISSELNDLMIVTVDQGDIALFEYNGQYTILGPGLHLIKDPMSFLKMIRLDKVYIKVGPEKWITVPDQYDGIALDNGKTVILEGGQQHHLSHENFKFAKFVPKILLTDRIVTDVVSYIDLLKKSGGALPTKTEHVNEPSYYLQTKTKDGSVICLDAMLFWQVTDTELAARKAMNILELEKESNVEEDEIAHIEHASRNIDSLRMIVLRFAKAALSEMVGGTSLTEEESLGTKVSKAGRSSKLSKLKEDPNTEYSNPVGKMSFAIQNFLMNQTENLLDKLNRDVNPYGVTIQKITVNDAIPTKKVQEQLDRQVKARIDQNTALVEAETAKRVAGETIAADRVNKIGTANNIRDAAEIEKQKIIILAGADAEAEKIRARGKKEAAEELSSTPLGQQLALIEAFGDASENITGKGDKVYFGLPLAEITDGIRQFGQAVNFFKPERVGPQGLEHTLQKVVEQPNPMKPK